MMTIRPGIPHRALRSLLTAAALVVCLATAEPARAQCSMCASAAESGDVGRGLQISIFFMLGTLLTLVSGVVVLVVRANRRDGAPGDPSGPPAPRA